MARLAPKELNLSDCDRLELQQLVNRHNTAQQIVLRAKIILLALLGEESWRNFSNIRYKS